ncbi:hypothetical protein RP20_CCG022332 [Aedes albopictus]|nr:hypothetical protein RP20_CCG022332 [Aedes albopictus]
MYDAPPVAQRGRIVGPRDRRHSPEGERQGGILAEGVSAEPQQSPGLHLHPVEGLPGETNCRAGDDVRALGPTAKTGPREEIEKEAPKECPKKLALCAALSTVLQRFFVTRPNTGSPIDKVHHFVSREKSFKSRLMSKHRKQDILGHNLRLQPYYEVTRCNHCQNILWGVSPQGYHCSNCELNIHRACAKDLNECCPGPTPLKNDSSKITKLMEKISSRNHHQADRTRRHDDDGAGEDGMGVGKYILRFTYMNESYIRLRIILYAFCLLEMPYP